MVTKGATTCCWKAPPTALTASMAQRSRSELPTSQLCLQACPAASIVRQRHLLQASLGQLCPPKRALLLSVVTQPRPIHDSLCEELCNLFGKREISGYPWLRGSCTRAPSRRETRVVGARE